MKVIRGTPKHLSRTGELNSFTYLMVNLEFECNYRCPKCFNRGDNSSNTPLTNPITLDDRIGVINQAKDLGGKVIVIAGEGEPSMHTDIRTLIAEIKHRGLIPIVYSNGRLLNKEVVDFYKKHDTVLVISLDSLKPRRYDLLTGTRGQHKTVMENIDNIRYAYRPTIVQEGDLTIMNVALNTTVSGVNCDEIGAIKSFCGDDIYFICNPLAKLGNAVFNWEKLMSRGEVTDEPIKTMSESGGPLTLGADGLCGYSRWGVAVSPTGDYMTCAYTHLTNGLLSNIRESSLRQAFEYKQRMEATHYDTHGKAPCLVRSKAFNDYVRHLSGQRAFFTCYGRNVGL